MAGFGPPAVDFYSQLSGLGDTLQANALLRQKQQINEARKAAFSDFSALDPSSPDYGRQALTVAQKLGSVGDQDGALKFLTLAQTAADRAHTIAREGVTDQHWNQDYSLRKAAAARADEGPEEEAGYRANAATKYGLKPGTPEFQTYTLTGKLPDSVANGGQPEVGLNPAYGVGPDGKPAAIQFSKTGKAVQTQLPEGFSLSKEPIRVDAGTHINLIDPITRTVIGTIPKNIAGAEAAKEEGSAQGLAKVALPQALATAEQGLKTITQLKEHPGLDHSVGLWSMLPIVPGSDRADFNAQANQLKGQTFLQAYTTLRGSGAITDIEGKKGEDAIARLDRAQSKAEYVKALNELQTVIQAGMLRAKAKAAGPSVQQFPAASPEAVALLKKNGRVDDFDAIFGPGAARQALGGG